MNGIDIPGYTILHELGSGGSRTAYLGGRELIEQPTVVKIFRTGDLHSLIENQRSRHSLDSVVAAELNLLRELSHPNLVRVFSHGRINDSWFIEEEFMDGGTVHSRLAEFDESKAAYAFMQLLNGVNFLHGKGFILRDIKLNNTLADKALSLFKIDDLELATRDYGLALSQTRGSKSYAAPELEAGGRASAASDIFSLGCCLYYLLTHEVGAVNTINRLGRDDYNRGLEKLIGKVHNRYRETLMGCLAYNPDDRFGSVFDIMNSMASNSPAEYSLFNRFNWENRPQTYLSFGRNGSSINLRDMAEMDLARVASIYSSAYSRHNIFNRLKIEVIRYIRGSQTTHSSRGGGFIVCYDGEDAVGSILLKVENIDNEQRHGIVKYSHTVSVNGFSDKDTIGMLLKAAENKLNAAMHYFGIKSALATATLSGEEIAMMPAFMENGFEKIGSRMHYHRRDEEAIVMSKLV